MTAEFFKYFNQILMQLFIYWSEFQSEIELGAFKTDQLQGRRRHQNSSKNLYHTMRRLRNSSRILIKLVMSNFTGRYIRWLRNFSNMSVIIPARNRIRHSRLTSFREEELIKEIPIKQWDDCEILQEFWSECWWVTLVVITSDDCGILYKFRSEFSIENS